LGLRDDHGRRCSEVAEFLGLLVNGSWRPIAMTRGPLYRIPAHRPAVFRRRQARAARRPRQRYAALVDIKDYADAVEPGILNALLYEDSEFIETQSFSIMPRREAMHALETPA